MVISWVVATSGSWGLDLGREDLESPRSTVTSDSMALENGQIGITADGGYNQGWRTRCFLKGDSES